MIRRFTAVLAVLWLCAPIAQARITFSFDYTYDTGFFTAPARAALEKAAEIYSDRLLDQLTDITPGGINTWKTDFSNPATGAPHVQILNLTIPANTLKIYVAGSNLGGALGTGGPGGYTDGSGNANFISNLVTRGQVGASGTSPTDFARWGGTIRFDNTTVWNFDLNAPVAGKNDFLTVAMHELAHVLGFGTADSWKTRLTSSGGVFVGPFTGPKAVALYGGPVPLETPAPGASAQHFNNSLMSTVGGIKPQETLMDPDIQTGTRKKLTLLDWAGLDDIGWDLAKGGDATADGSVDFNDLVALAQNYNVADGQRRWSQGDFNYDGNVDFNDLVILAQNYNTSGVQAAPDLPMGASADFAQAWAAARAEVPEPASLALIALATCSALSRRSRALRSSK